MSEVQNTPALEATPAVVSHHDTKPLETTDPSAETAAPAITEEATAPATTSADASTEATPTGTAEPISEESKIADSTKVAEPITSGVLGYKAPGLMKSLLFSKKYFWLGDEPISTQHMSHYLRNSEKAEIAHPNAAWASQTGKGLLFFVKFESEKNRPTDVINLSDISDLEKKSPHEFSFKIHGHKHTFKAADDAERDGWYTAIETAIPEAKSAKEGILSSEGYKESIGHLGKPAALAGGVAAGGATTVAGAKTGEHTKEAEHTTPSQIAEAETTPKLAPSDEEDNVAKKDKKGRSASRNKRGSIFGSLMGKKEEIQEKKEIKKEEKAEEKEANAEHKAEHEHKPVAEDAAVATAPFDAEAVAARATGGEESGPITTQAATEAPRDSAPSAPKKRNSIFGQVWEKVRSPTQEKREPDFGPSVPPKDEPISSEAPRLPEPAADSTGSQLAAPEEASAVTNAHEQTTAATSLPEDKVDTRLDSTAGNRTLGSGTTGTAGGLGSSPRELTNGNTTKKESFLGGLVNKVRAKSPASSKRSAPATTPSSTTEAPAVPAKDEEPVLASKGEETAAPNAEAAAPIEPTAATQREEPITNAATTEPAVTDSTAKATTPKDSRRKSYFGSDSEKPLSKFTNIFRRPSQAGKDVKTTKDAKPAVPEKIEEPATTETGKPAEKTLAENKVPETTSQQSIGDVVPEAVSVGQPQEHTPSVSAAA